MDDQITRYTPLVRSIARRYPLPPGWERSDIEQEGMIGLLNASRRYDPDGLHKNYPFPTVAAFAIKTQIRKALRLETGSTPDEIDVPDIADQPTMPIPVIAPAWMNSRITRPLPIISLDKQYMNHDGAHGSTEEMGNLLDVVIDPAPSVEDQVVAAVEGMQVSATLEAALLLLSAHQRSIIEHRFGLGGDRHEWTLEEIGQLLGRHRSNIYRQQVKALAILRAHLSESRDGQLILHRFEEKRAARARKRAAA